MIEILTAELVEEGFWACWLLLIQGIDRRLLPATAPETTPEADLLTFFESQWDHLWALAEQKQYEVDVFKYLPAQHTSNALLDVILDEINEMRVAIGGLPIKTTEELEAALLEKLISQAVITP